MRRGIERTLARVTRLTLGLHLRSQCSNSRVLVVIQEPLEPYRGPSMWSVSRVDHDSRISPGGAELAGKCARPGYQLDDEVL